MIPALGAWMAVGVTEAAVGALRGAPLGMVLLTAGVWPLIGLGLRFVPHPTPRSPWLPGVAYLAGSMVVKLDLRGVALVFAGIGVWVCVVGVVRTIGARLPAFALPFAIAGTCGGLSLRDALVPAPEAIPADTTRAVPRRSSAPTILLLTVDTLRADAAGHTFDALAARGLSGPTWSTAPWTLPALASVHTGRTPYAHGALVRAPVAGHTRIAGFSAPTLAERLSAAGWRTAAYVENAHVTRARGFARGFDTFDNLDDRSPPRSLLLDPFGRGLDLRPLVQRGRDPDARVTDALAWLHADDRPSFLWVHLLGPHLPWHDADTTPGTALFDALGTEPTRLNLDHLRRGSLRLTPALRAELVAAYRSEAYRADRALARLVAAAPDAVVVYTADHGEALGEHGAWEHGHALTEEVVRVPLAIAGPGVVPGRFVAASLADVAPTIAVLAGVPFPGADGVDLRANPLPERPLFLEDTLYWEEREGVVAWPYKLVRTLAGGDTRLSDLSATGSDPEAAPDLDLPDVRAALGRLLDAEHARLGDTPEGTVNANLRALGYTE